METNYSDMTDRFEKYEVDTATFSHQHHVGVAFEMLKRHGFLSAAQKYSDIINTVATAAGAGQKFNTTITVAFLSIIDERMRQDDYDDACVFIEQNRDLLEQNPLVPLYSKKRITSDLARKTFLLPDLNPVQAA